MLFERRLQKRKRMVLDFADKDGNPKPLGYIFVGIIVVIILAIAIWILNQAFFGSGIIKTIFWIVVGISAVIGAFYGIGKLVFWIRDEFF